MTLETISQLNQIQKKLRIEIQLKEVGPHEDRFVEFVHIDPADIFLGDGVMQIRTQTTASVYPLHNILTFFSEVEEFWE